MPAKQIKNKTKGSKGGSLISVIFSQKDIELVNKLAGTLNTKQIADHFGISYETFLIVRKRQPELDKAYKMGKAKMIDDVANSLAQAALNGNVVAAMFFLKTQAGWREKDRPDDLGDEDDDYKGPTPLLVEFVTKDPKDNMKEVKEVEE